MHNSRKVYSEHPYGAIKTLPQTPPSAWSHVLGNLIDTWLVECNRWSVLFYEFLFLAYFFPWFDQAVLLFHLALFTNFLWSCVYVWVNARIHQSSHQSGQLFLLDQPSRGKVSWFSAQYIKLWSLLFFLLLSQEFYFNWNETVYN